MAKSGRKEGSRRGIYDARGAEASRLRRRKYTLIRKYGFPEGMLGGSLNRVFNRCGKDGCHCATGDGHPRWTLTYSVAGVKHVESIPATAVKALGPLLNEGRAYQAAVKELRSINAQLLSLWKRSNKK